jgi:hypothetical protein
MSHDNSQNRSIEDALRKIDLRIRLWMDELSQKYSSKKFLGHGKNQSVIKIEKD